jgi:aspartyl-tRNA(Asn)/glutamyl-tRNA(Gln) amidotransferase subunit B
MFKRIDTTEFVTSGNLQRDSLEYLCISEETQQATLQQIANDLVQLHRLQEAEKRLGSDLTRSKLSEAEMLIKQKHSVEQIAKDLIEIVWEEGRTADPRAIVEARGMKQVTDTGAIEAAVDAIIAANPDKVAQAQAKPTMLGWFVGQVMKETGGKANPQSVNDLLKSKLGI